MDDALQRIELNKLNGVECRGSFGGLRMQALTRLPSGGPFLLDQGAIADPSNPVQSSPIPTLSPSIVD